MFENLDKLQDLEDRYLDLEAKISDPEVIARPNCEAAPSETFACDT